MKANELRIGSWIYIPQIKTNERIGVIEENGRFTTKGYKSSYSSIECLEPIPLTEEWLLKFGFEKNDNNQFILMEGSVDILFNKDLNGWTCDGINFSINMTEHVHQLQNLYFALTGEELKLKEDESQKNNEIIVLDFLYNRLINKYGENENYDYMIAFRNIINSKQ
jgi:hypothetical protein